MHGGIKDSQFVPIEKAGHGFFYEEREIVNPELVMHDSSSIISFPLKKIDLGFSLPKISKP
jgi:hypothetical protein